MKALLLGITVFAMACDDGNRADEEQGHRSTYSLANSGSADAKDTVSTDHSYPENMDSLK